MRTIERIWQSRSLKSAALLPISFVFGMLSGLRRFLYRVKILKSSSSGVPVVVVGNLSVGGTGKSPVIQALAKEFEQLGWRPGIVSRGYGGLPQEQPLLIDESTMAAMAGDEPVMHHRYTELPVCVCTNRALAVQRLVQHGCTLVLSDDGLQHYAMQRDAEIVVVDGGTGFGNGWLLPAGPLREPMKRLTDVSVVLIKELVPSAESKHSKLLTEKIHSYNRSVARFALLPTQFSAVADGSQLALDSFRGRRVHALAGIGQPGQFFSLLRNLGMEVVEHPFDDHHNFSESDIAFEDQLPVIVTAKDAAKFTALPEATDNLYVLEVTAFVDDELRSIISTLSDTLKSHG